MRPRASAITACGMPRRSSSQAVSRAPWSSGRVSSDPDVRHAPCLPGGADRAERRPVAARREPAGVAVREDARRAREELDRVRAHPPAALDLVRVDLLGALRESGRLRICVERPAQVDRSRARRGERLGRDVEVLPALAASASPYAAAMPIAGAPRTASTRIASATSAAVSQRSSTSSSGQPPLVEHDDGVVLEPDDPLRIELAAAHADDCTERVDESDTLARSATAVPTTSDTGAAYVPSSQLARYLACSSVSSSIATPIVASLSRAISSSISVGTSYTLRSSDAAFCDHVLGCERLVGERHVHHLRRMPLGRRRG